MVVTNPNSAPIYQRLRRTERGQSLVEFAFLLLPFLFVTIASIELGRAWTVKQALTNAAREGTRVLVLPYGTTRTCPDIDCSNASNLREAALTTTKYYLTSAGISVEAPLTEITFIKQTVDNNSAVSTEPLSSEPQTGEYVGMHITYQYTSVVEAFITGNNSTITMSSTSVMRHE